MAPLSERDLLPPEYAALGLLLLRPMHGYEMARALAGDLAEVCPVEQSSLYTYLRNLEVRGLVTWSETRVGNRPPRKIFELTAVGRAAVEAWLAEPVARLREVRLDFLLKLYFLHQLDPAAETRLLREQVEVCEAYRERLAGRRPGAGFPALVLTSKLSAAEATLGWLRVYTRQLEEETGE
jgi:DNA-binding PadR family transcriptional regulator